MNNLDRAQWQTNEVGLWLLNDEPTYNAFVGRLERGYPFNGESAKNFVIAQWGNCTPGGDGISRVRWGEIAKLMNAEVPRGYRVRDIKRLNKAAGGHFFDNEVMINPLTSIVTNTRGVIDGSGQTSATLFITSIQMLWVNGSGGTEYTPRVYKIRKFDHATYGIVTVSKHYDNLERALNGMRAYPSNH